MIIADVPKEFVSVYWAKKLAYDILFTTMYDLSQAYLMEKKYKPNSKFYRQAINTINECNLFFNTELYKDICGLLRVSPAAVPKKIKEDPQKILMMIYRSGVLHTQRYRLKGKEINKN